MAVSRTGRPVAEASPRDGAVLPEAVYRTLPGELWGVYNQLTKNLKGYAAKKLNPSPQAFAGAAADFSYVGDENQVEQPSEQQLLQQQTELRKRLDYKPKLSALDVCLCAVIPAAICTALFFGIRPAKLTWIYALGLSMIYVAWAAISRVLLLERYYTARLVDGRELADSGSKFKELDSVSVHYKVHSSGSTPAAAVHCYHGFGANTGSWDPVQRQMASRLQAVVTSNDMPGFGLTDRPKDIKKYSLAFNGRAGRQLLHSELADLQASSKGGEKRVRPSAGGASPDEVKPEILIGHSMGAACAAAEALKNPQGIRGLVLEAPAVIAFQFAIDQAMGKPGRVEREGGAAQAHFSHQQLKPKLKQKRRQKNIFLRLVVALTQTVLLLTSGFWTWLLQPVTVVSLRSAVRSRAFWERGLRLAWHNKPGVTPQIVDAYRRPQLIRGWEKGIINVTAARMAGGRGFGQIMRDAWKGRVEPTQAEALADLISKGNIKVLIIHGEKDALVPLSNSIKLSKLLPNAQLEVMKNTGHIPHEERPEEFLDLVQNFMSTL